MKKKLALILVLAMLFSLAGSVFAFADETEQQEETDYAKVIDEIWENLKELDRLGEVDGTPVAYVTFTNDMMGGATQEDLDADVGEMYVSANVAEDGTVTFVVTKEQHLALFAEMAEVLAQSIKEMVESGMYKLTGIVCGKDFTSYDVYLSTEDVEMNESILTVVFAIYGEIGAMISGYDYEETVITASYYNVNNELVYEWSSEELG